MLRALSIEDFRVLKVEGLNNRETRYASSITEHLSEGDKFTFNHSLNQTLLKHTYLQPDYPAMKLYGHMRDMTGETFDYLTAIKPIRINDKRYVVWLCKCVCDRYLLKPSNILRGTMYRDRVTLSCGCKGKRKLTRDQVDEIRASTKSQYQLAKEYGVSRTTIQCIVHRKTWQWLV